MSASITIPDGPLFTTSVGPELNRAIEEGLDDVGRFAVEEVQAELDSNLRNPTGRYQSGIGVRVEGLSSVVHDSDSPYGPWLEGTGSRNRTSRFKGYGSFRRAAARIERRARELVEQAIERRLR